MDRRHALRALGVLGLLPLLPGCAADPPAGLTIATGPVVGVYYRLGSALAPVWRDALGMTAPPAVLPTAGSVDNLARLASREADVVISQIDTAADDDARTARDDPLSPRALARLYDDVVHIVVPRDSPITSIRQLRDLPVSVGAPASGVYVVAQRILLAIGLPVEPVQLSLGDAAAALRAGRIAAFIWSGGLPTDGVSSLEATFPIRLLDLGDVQQEIRATQSVYARGTVPAGSYGARVPITTLFVRNVLLVRAEMSDDLAHALVAALFAQQSRIAQASPAASTIDPRSAIGTEPVLLHPGAQRWFRERDA